MAFSADKQKNVLDFIDKATSEYLDNYIRDSIKHIASSKMNETSATSQQVADAVYDEILENYSGDISMAITCKQIYPKMYLMVLRNEIIKTLNAK